MPRLRLRPTSALASLAAPPPPARSWTRRGGRGANPTPRARVAIFPRRPCPVHRLTGWDHLPEVPQTPTLADEPAIEIPAASAAHAAAPAPPSAGVSVFPAAVSSVTGLAHTPAVSSAPSQLAIEGGRLTFCGQTFIENGVSRFRLPASGGCRRCS